MCGLLLAALLAVYHVIIVGTIRSVESTPWYHYEFSRDQAGTWRSTLWLTDWNENRGFPVAYLGMDAKEGAVLGRGVLRLRITNRHGTVLRDRLLDAGPCLQDGWHELVGNVEASVPLGCILVSSSETLTCDLDVSQLPGGSSIDRPVISIRGEKDSDLMEVRGLLEAIGWVVVGLTILVIVFYSIDGYRRQAHRQ